MVVGAQEQVEGQDGMGAREMGTRAGAERRMAADPVPE